MFQGPIQLQQMLESLQGQVHNDKWGMNKSGDKLVAYHVQPMIVRGLYSLKQRASP